MAKPELRSGLVPGGSIPAVIFAHWREVLNRAPVSEAVRGGYALAIGGYLDYCRHNGLSVTAESARGYVADAQRRKLARNAELWKHKIQSPKSKHRTSNIQCSHWGVIGQREGRFRGGMAG